MAYKIITAVWNAAPFFPAYVESVRMQRHRDFDVVVVDDCSTDGTREMVVDATRRSGWTAILNSEPRGALYNQVHGIRALDCQPDDVLVFVDGDDRLAHPNVLNALDKYYADDTKLAYGQYAPDPPSRTCQLAAPFPQEIIDERSFRHVAANKGGIWWNHIRTFKYELFAQLTDDDFKDPNGKFYQTATDAALMYPCLELAAPHIKFIPEVLYLYSSENPASDWRRWPRQCDRDHMHILGKKPKR